MQPHEELRPLLFSIAYRMLGGVRDAEDVVQEAFLRLQRAEREGTRVQSPRAFLTTVTTRLAIDRLRSARTGRETYPVHARETTELVRKGRLPIFGDVPISSPGPGRQKHPAPR